VNSKLVLSITLIIILMSVLGVSFKVENVKAESSIYIRVDGSVDPPTAPILSIDNITYTFTDDVYEKIVVQRSNIVVDGSGYTLQGSGVPFSNSIGFCLFNVNNVTIKNTNIRDFAQAVYLNSASNNTISRNNMTNNEWYGIILKSSSNNIIRENDISNNHDGIVFEGSSNYNTISENNIRENKQMGIWISSLYDQSTASNFNNISGNNIENNCFGIRLEWSSKNNIVGNMFTNNGLSISDSSGNFVEGNVVNGKPLVYLEDISDYTVDDAGQVILINCANILVEKLNLSNIDIGVNLQRTNNSIIANNKIWSNKIGIVLLNCSNSNIIGNNMTNNENGIYLQYSSNNSICGNILVNNCDGIVLSESSYNSVFGNNITDNKYGVSVYSSSNNNITGNNIGNNHRLGIALYSSNSSIFHNNFVNNTQQVHLGSSDIVNYWNDDYPSGGNYWSDYTGVDEFSGSHQNDTGFDWIGDTPYIINDNNRDNYPLIDPYTLEKHGTQVAYRNLQSNHNELQGNYDSLQAIYQNLRAAYDLLNFSYNDLNTALNELKSEQEATINELNNIRNLMYIFMAATVILIATTVYITKRWVKR